MATKSGTPTEVKKRPASKRVAKRPAPPKKKGATKPPTKATKAKKPATRKPPVKAKATPKKAAVKKTAPVRETDEHGFIPGGDSAKIAELLLTGGKDRQDINAKVLKKIGGTTRNDTPKNVPALVSGVLNRLLEQGYKVESSWVLVPPTRKRRKPSTKK